MNSGRTILKQITALTQKLLEVFEFKLTQSEIEITFDEEQDDNQKRVEAQHFFGSIRSPDTDPKLLIFQSEKPSQNKQTGSSSNAV